ncbi:UBC-like protein [Suillus plorans]|uniref:UBC-like protein n=1 Tax=Suillus plorans TaxID=116603 RepID=A0A9P7DZK6_9AGAM|nr:UBC-like protein [Suillus plorans]KAG1806831.1 UBC-like protein [Suillus plorans]
MPSASLVSSTTIDLGLAKGRSTSTKIVQTADLVHPEGSITSPATRATLNFQYASLRNINHCPTGMYITPSVESTLVWDAVLFVHKGYYQDSVLKFTVTFPNDYPERPPTVRFLTDIFHPLVDPRTGGYSLAPRFRPWRPKEHQIHHILHFMKSTFKEPTLDKLHEEDVLNKEAFNLATLDNSIHVAGSYRDNRTSFATLAKQSAELSQSPSALYDTSGSKKNHSLRFIPLKSNEVDQVLGALSVHTEDSK